MNEHNYKINNQKKDSKIVDLGHKELTEENIKLKEETQLFNKRKVISDNIIGTLKDNDFIRTNPI